MRDRNIHKIINYIITSLLIFLLFYFFVWSFSRGDGYNIVELQLANDSYTTDMVMELEKQYKKDNNIVFWRQLDSVEIINEDLNRSVNTSVIAMRGDSELIINEGISLLPEDSDSCVIGEKTAFDLYGSIDVVGLSITYEGKEYRIADVLSTNKNVFLYQVQNDDFVFDRMMALVRNDETKSKCINRLNIQYGIYGTLIDYEFEFFIIRLLAMLIFVALLLYGIRRLRKYICSRIRCSEAVYFIIDAVTLILNIIIIIICFSKLNLPVDYIPTGWSDYLHWGEFFREKTENVKNLIIMKKNISDFSEYFTFVKFTILMFCILITWIVQIMSNKKRKID